MGSGLIMDINNLMEVSLPESISLEELKQKLTLHINHLINHDFEKLIFYLYRIDVDEKKMRALLEYKEAEDAGGLIAGLIIERQQQKIKSRKENKNDTIIPEDDKW